MISFKEFLVEASTGKAKWEKYFNTGDDVETIAKKDAGLFDAFDKPVKKTVKKGDKITVLAADEYEPKLTVRIGDGEYRMKIADIEKPFQAERVVGTDLKPDKLGIFGPKFISKYGAEVKKLIDKKTEIPEVQAEYLKALIDLAENPNDRKYIEAAQDAFVFADVAEDSAFRNTINNDFMEVLGPFFVVNEKPEYKAGGVKFPEAGNEPLYDFTMKAKTGANEKIDSFSSKRAGGNSNTLKVTEVLKAVDSADSKFKKKYYLEIELLKIIQENSVKAAPEKINEWLAKHFPHYKKVQDPVDNIEIARLENSVVKYITDHSDLDFTPLVQQAVPDLWYVKSRLATDGTIIVEPLKSGRDIEKARLRSKSSPGHLADKIGFAM
jgi:hypothetical protein